MSQQYYEYLEDVDREKRRHPSLRMGQAYFNVIHATDVEFAEEIAGGPLDPFYSDDTIPSFLDALRERWGVPVLR